MGVFDEVTSELHFTCSNCDFISVDKSEVISHMVTCDDENMLKELEDTIYGDNREQSDGKENIAISNIISDNSQDQEKGRKRKSSSKRRPVKKIEKPITAAKPKKKSAEPLIGLLYGKGKKKSE